MTVVQDWGKTETEKLPAYDEPPQREDVCHIGSEEVMPGLWRSYCNVVVAEPECCALGYTKCGRPRCQKCVLASGGS